MMFWLSYFRANLKIISCWTKTQGNLGFLSVTTVDNSVYYMPIGNASGWLKVFYSMVVITDGSRSLIAAKSLRRFCEELAKSLRSFTGIFIVLSQSELSNSIVTEVVQRLLTNLIYMACAIRHLRLDSECVSFCVSVNCESLFLVEEVLHRDFSGRWGSA